MSDTFTLTAMFAHVSDVPAKFTATTTEQQQWSTY
jgi:hypothetical protein